MKSILYQSVIVLLSLIILPKDIYSQNNDSSVRDSLFNILNAYKKEDTNRVKDYVSLIKTYKNENQTEGINYGLQGLDLSKKINYKTGIIDLNIEISSLYKQIKDYNKSEEYIIAALDLSKEGTDKSRLAKIYQVLGIINYARFNLTKALDYYFLSLNLYTDLNDKINIAGLLGNIGIIYWGLTDYQSSLDYFNKALEISKTTGNKENMVFCLGNIAGVYSELKQSDKALETYSEALKIDEELGDKDGQAGDLVNIATMNIYNRDYDKALINNNKSYQLNKEIDNLYGMLYNYGCYGDLYYSMATDSLSPKISKLKKEEYLSKSLYNYLEAIKICQKFSAFKELVEIYGTVSNIYKYNKNWEKAYYYQELSNSLKDSVYNEETKTKILKLETKQVTELKDKEIHILSQEKEYSNLKNYFLLASLILVSIIIIIIYIFYRKTKRDNKLLLQQNLIISEKEKLVNELNAAKDKFFSIIAHDLKNPIGSFRNMSEILYHNIDSFDETELKECLCDIKDASKVVYDLLDNLLIWSRSQRGMISYEPVEADLSFIVDNCFYLLKPNADDKNIELESFVSSDMIVQCDTNMISTIIRNLVSNSIKFTNHDGKVSVNAEASDGEIILSVIDNGIGMSEDTQSKLFKIDQNFSTPGTMKEKGTGLGLILCKEFVEKNGGRIWVESKINMGTTFRFSIPKLK